MHKGMCSALWVLFFALLTACHHDSEPPPPPPEPNQVELSGQIMLGPVVRGHSLEVLIVDANGKELDRPKVGLDGSYGSILKDYDGIVYLQVKSNNPDQCIGDYIDEATAELKCLGNNKLLSATTVKSGSSNNQAKIHSTPLTTVAVISLGVTTDDKGIISLPKNLSKEAITNANKVVAKVFGLGDQSIAEYTPKSIVTTDQKFQRGDAYAHALAAISGIEAQGKSLNNIVKQITESIDQETGQLNPQAQDMMVKGVQRVAKKLIEKSADKAILEEVNKNQGIYKKSIMVVDLINSPKPPVFTNKNKTAHTKPTWSWKSAGTGGSIYRYVFGTEKNIDTKRNWTNIDTNSFKPSTPLKPEKYILRLQQAHASKPNKWSEISESIIEVVVNSKGVVSISGDTKQDQTLKALVSDTDGVDDDTVIYQWYRDNIEINQATNEQYKLTQDDVNKTISLTINYTDSTGKKETITSLSTVKVKNINDQPVFINIPSGLTATENKLFKYQVEVSDIDGITGLSYRLIDPPVGMSIEPNGLIQWEPGDSVSGGNKFFEVEVNDGSMANNATNTLQLNVLVTALNDKPDGDVTIKKSVIQNDVLTANVNLSDADGIKSGFKYQWYRYADHSSYHYAKKIDGATSKNYTARNDDVNLRLYVEVSYTDISNFPNTVKSNLTETVADTNDPPTDKPIIEGGNQQKTTLKAKISHIDDPDGILVGVGSFQWKRDDKDVGQNIHEYQLTQSDVGKRISVVYTYRDGEGFENSVESEKTELIKNINDDPSGTVTIIGADNATQGQKLTASIDEIKDLDGIKHDSYTYLWIVDNQTIQGETRNTLELSQVHVGKKIKLQVNYEDKFGFKEKVTSNETENVIDLNDAPTIADIIIDNAKEINDSADITLVASDPDLHPNNVIQFKVIELPKKGMLTKKGTNQPITKDELFSSETALTYTRQSAGEDSFVYIARDVELESNHAKVTIQYQNIAPTVSNSEISATEQIESSEITLVSNDDQNADLQYQITQHPLHGNLYLGDEKLTGDRKFTKNEILTYKSESDSATSDSFNFIAHDGQLESINSATVSINITSVNDAPTIADITIGNAKEINDSAEITLVASDPDSNHPTLFKLIELPTKGTLRRKGTNESIERGRSPFVKSGTIIIYTRKSAGEDSFIYIAKDGQLETNHAKATIQYKNIAPTVSNSEISATEQIESSEITLVSNDDQDADLQYQITQYPSHGNLYLGDEKLTDDRKFTKNEILTYKSESDSATSDSFNFIAHDGQLESKNSATVSIIITEVNDAPKIQKIGDQSSEVFIGDEEYIMNAPVVKFKFRITDDSPNYGSSTTKYLNTKNNALNNHPRWISHRKVDYETVNGNVNAYLDLEYEIDLEHIYNYDSIRVLIPAHEIKSTNNLHKLAFIIKPTEIISEKNNIKAQNNTTWVDVCWQISDELLGAMNNDFSQLENTKDKIIDTVTKSWEKHSAVKFDWRKDQWNQYPRYKWNTHSNCAENYDVDGFTQLKILLNKKGERPQQNTDKVTISFYIKDDGSLDYNDEHTKTYSIIHEFGHALGFPDENKRLDIFKKQADPSTCSHIENETPIIASNSSIITKNAIKQISYKTFQQQLYDANSVMNECITADKYFTDIANTTGNLLSDADIEKVQKHYGAPVNNTPHYLKNNQFLSGLYLYQNKYKYFENGIEKNDFTSIDKNKISAISNGSYFAIRNNDESETILFNYNAADATLIKPASDILTACRAFEFSENSFLATSLQCQSIESFGEEKGYLDSGTVDVYYEYVDSENIKTFYCDSSKTVSTNSDSETIQDMNSCLSDDQVIQFKSQDEVSNNLFIRGVPI